MMTDETSKKALSDNIIKVNGNKDAQMIIRLEKDLRDRFVEACQSMDPTASRKLRRFIKGFMRQYEIGEFND